MGQVAFDVCTKCYRWKIVSVLGFQWGVTLWGFGITLFAELEGRLDVEELPCDRAGGSEYCEFLDIYLDHSETNELTKTSRCHSNSPMRVLFDYLGLRWRMLKDSMQSTGKKGPNNQAEWGQTAIQRKLTRVTQDMQKYPSILSPPAAAKVGADLLENEEKRKRHVSVEIEIHSIRAINLGKSEESQACEEEKKTGLSRCQGVGICSSACTSLTLAKPEVMVQQMMAVPANQNKNMPPQLPFEPMDFVPSDSMASTCKKKEITPGAPTPAIPGWTTAMEDSRKSKECRWTPPDPEKALTCERDKEE